MTSRHDNTLAAGAATTGVAPVVPETRAKTAFVTRLAAYAAALAPAAFPIANPDACWASGGTYEITITGELFVGDGDPFGIPLPAPFSFSIVYNTTFDTDSTILPAGTNVGGGVILQHPFHAYSPSGIVSTDLTYGTQTWTAANIRVLPFTQNGVWGPTPHYIWFDTDITSAAPTRCYIWFSASGADLNIGGYHTGLGTLTDSCDVHDAQGPGPAFASGNSLDITVTDLDSPYSRQASTIDSGGGTRTSTDNLYTMQATIGQHDAAPPTTGTNGVDTLRPGYWENIPPPPCIGDINLDGLRNTTDLVVFLGNFGLNVPPGLALADFNNDNIINTADLVTLLGNFGAPCPQ